MLQLFWIKNKTGNHRERKTYFDVDVFYFNFLSETSHQKRMFRKCMCLFKFEKYNKLNLWFVSSELSWSFWSVEIKTNQNILRYGFFLNTYLKSEQGALSISRSLFNLAIFLIVLLNIIRLLCLSIPSLNLLEHFEIKYIAFTNS